MYECKKRKSLLLLFSIIFFYKKKLKSDERKEWKQTFQLFLATIVWNIAISCYPDESYFKMRIILKKIKNVLRNRILSFFFY